jgi:rare lipoprotein A (peptidoglycan hydrolase)
MRKLVLLITLASLVPAAAVAKPSLEDQLEDARGARAHALAEARFAAARLAELEVEYLKVEAAANEAAAYLVDSLIRERELRGQMAQAQAFVDARANAAYRAGPGAFLNALLEARSFGELTDTHELIEYALLGDVDVASEALEVARSAGDVREDLEDARARLVARQHRLGALLTEMQIVLAAAREAAHRAGTAVQSLAQKLDQQARRLKEAKQSYEGRLELLEGFDQSELLAMLGPTGGRGCQIPPKLEGTGDRFGGEASFYGEEFAGQSTAMGAIFDPALFTAAHLTLPLPSFLHVKYGDRCATVLVNDRGPYIDGRVLDLSQGAATYLGMAHAGVGMVTAEILVPR